MDLLREVAEKVNRPFGIKLDETREVITKHFEEFGDKVAVAFSGGKDSEVVLWLCLQVNANVPVVFNNTGVEYPETIRFVSAIAESWNLNITITHPEKSFWQCIEDYGFPVGSKRKSRGKMCCYWLKEKPMLIAIRNRGYLGWFTGTTAVESWQRMFHARDKGICYHVKKFNTCKINPILWWTQEEVWQFIERECLPINEIYARGAERVGCMPCTAHRDWEQQLQKTNPKLYRIIKLRKDNQYVMELAG